MSERVEGFISETLISLIKSLKFNREVDRHLFCLECCVKQTGNSVPEFHSLCICTSLNERVTVLLKYIEKNKLE